MNQIGHDDATVSVLLNDVHKTYHSSITEVAALRGVNFSCAAGQRVAILGKSGCGKSTLLNLLGGLDRPTQGKVIVNGGDLARMSPAHLANYRGRQVGMVFQSFNLLPDRNAIQNVELPLVFAGVPPAVRRQRASDMLSAVGLQNRLTHHPFQLSGGQQQRVAIARALVNRPRLLLADEPTGNLDSATESQIIALLDKILGESGVTMLMVTHDKEIASCVADRIVEMKDGLLEADYEVS